MGRVTTSGGSACHLSVSPDGCWIGVTNHGQDFGGSAGGSVAVISVCPESGDVLAQTDFVLHEQPTDPKLLVRSTENDTVSMQIGALILKTTMIDFH